MMDILGIWTHRPAEIRLESCPGFLDEHQHVA